MAITITPVSSTTRIFIKDTPRALEGPVILFEGDSAHLSLAVKSDLYYHYGALRLSGGAAARAIDIKRIGYVPSILDAPVAGLDDYYERSPEHLYPDVLEPVDPKRINCQPGFNQAFFLTIKDSEKIPVGDNKVTATVTATYDDGNKVVGKASFIIRKVAARLPKQRCISTCWMHYDSFIAQHNVKLFTKDFYKIFGSYLDAAVYSGQTMLLVPIFTPAFDTERGTERLTAQLLDIREDEDGSFHFDFTKLHEFIKFARAHGIEQLEMPPLFTQWGAEHAPKIMVKKPNGRTVRRFGWETDSLSDEYRRFLTTLIPQLVAEMRSIGMEEQTFFHVSDEPHVDQLERYNACKAMITPLLGNCRTLDACSDIAFAGKNEREYAVPIVNKLDPFIEAGCRPLCTYFCCSPVNGYFPNRHFGMPLQRLIVLGAMLYKYDIALFLQWGFNFYNTFLSRRSVSPYGNTDCDVQYAGGDAFIVYPNYADRSCNMSIRLVAMREMFRLSRILYLLEEKIGKDAVIALLDAEGVRYFNDYPREDGWMDGFIVRLAEMLEK